MFLPAFAPLAAQRRGPWRTDDVVRGAMLFARGRLALFEGLRALAAVRGIRRLWAPAYACRPVADVAAAAGLDVAWYDVDERLEPRWTAMAPARGDAVLVIHYFGLALAPRALEDFGRAHEVPLVEDCAHAVPDPTAAVRIGTSGALAVFSPRKQVAVPGGGLLTVNDPEVRAVIGRPPRAGLGDLRTLARLAIMLVERAAFGLDLNVLRLKDRLPVLDAHPAAATGAAWDGVADRSEYAAAPAPSWLLSWMLACVDWHRVIRARQSAYRGLARRLCDVPGVSLPVAEAPPGSVPQALPIRVADPDRVVRVLRGRGIEAMRWPGREQVPFSRTACPGTAEWLDRGLLLPLGAAPSPARLDAVARAVARAVAPPAAGARRAVARAAGG